MSEEYSVLCSSVRTGWSSVPLAAGSKQRLTLCM
jgi:hypothetical protein